MKYVAILLCFWGVPCTTSAPLTSVMNCKLLGTVHIEYIQVPSVVLAGLSRIHRRPLTRLVEDSEKKQLIMVHHGLIL